MIGRFCIFRTYSAGVHMGYLEEINGTCALVKEARRLWRWTERFTLNEIANQGASAESRISNPVDEIYLTQVIEVIPCSKKAENDLRKSRNQSV
jgi:hypothetical protein